MSVLNLSQIAYLENLLKVYNEEIYRLQQAELSLDDLGSEESLYIQEHKLKRKVSLEFDAARSLSGYKVLNSVKRAITSGCVTAS